MPKFDAVLFDFDGTVADTGEGVLASANEAFAALGYPQMEPAAFRPFLGPPLRQNFTDLIGMSPEEAERGVVIFRAAYAAGNCFRLRVYDGLETLLQRLAAERIPVAVASSKLTIYLEKILEGIGLRRYFAAVCGTEQGQNDSDKTALLLRAAQGCGAQAGRCLMIGDRRFDMEAAKGLGMCAAGVLYGFGDAKELLDSGADMLAANCEELEKYIFGQV